MIPLSSSSCESWSDDSCETRAADFRGLEGPGAEAAAFREVGRVAREEVGFVLMGAVFIRMGEGEISSLAFPFPLRLGVVCERMGRGVVVMRDGRKNAGEIGVGELRGRGDCVS